MTIRIPTLKTKLDMSKHLAPLVLAPFLILISSTPASAADPRIDALRKKMVVKEHKHFTDDYEARHGNGNAIQVFFRDGTKTPRIEIEFSVGDPRRRREGVPLLEKKFRGNLARRYAKKQLDAVYALMTDQKKLEATPVNEFMDLLAG